MRSRRKGMFMHRRAADSKYNVEENIALGSLESPSAGHQIDEQDSSDQIATLPQGSGNGEAITPCNHAQGPGPLHTCTHPYHSVYSEASLPPLLFRLDPPRSRDQNPIDVLVENDQRVMGSGGYPIRNFWFLPRYISVQVPGWLLEYWMRTDGRLSYKDIRARMEAPLEELPTENSLNMRREREARGPLHLSCWTNTRTQITKAELKRVECWSHDQIAYNTTMVIEYTSGVRNVPMQLRSKTLIPAKAKVYPLRTFLQEGEEIHTASQRVRAAIDLFYQLSERASAERLDSWEVLHDGGIRGPRKAQRRRRTTSDGKDRSKRIRRSRILGQERELVSDGRENIITGIGVMDRASVDEDCPYEDDYETSVEQAGSPVDGEIKRLGDAQAVLPGQLSRFGTYDENGDMIDADESHHVPSDAQAGDAKALILSTSWNSVNRFHHGLINSSDFSQTLLPVIRVVGSRAASHTASSARKVVQDEDSSHNNPSSTSDWYYELAGPLEEDELFESFRRDPEIMMLATLDPPAWFDPHRYNSYGPRSIRNDRLHAVNTHTAAIIRHNNLFSPGNLNRNSMPMSFEMYLKSSIKQFEAARFSGQFPENGEFCWGSDKDHIPRLETAFPKS